MRKKAVHDDFDLDFAAVDAPEQRDVQVGRLFGANPAARIGAAGLVALGVAIAVNVVFLQDQRHAAPLFQTSLRSQASMAPDQPVVLPLPAPRPVELAPAPKAAAVGRADPIGREIARLDQQPARVDKSKAVESKSVEPKADARQADAIGGLIRNVVAPQPAPGVLAAQRALMKLGFVLRPDGVFGGTTQQAIERFERDNRMPVRGELTARVKAELSRQSGVEIE